MEAGLKVGFNVLRSFSAHAFAFEWESMSIVVDAVEDRIRQRWIADGLMPMLNRELAGDDD